MLGVGRDMHPAKSEPPTTYIIYRTMADRPWIKLDNLYCRPDLLTKARLYWRSLEYHSRYAVYSLLRVIAPTIKLYAGHMSGPEPFSYRPQLPEI